MSEVTRILDAIQQGDPKAAEELLPLVYHELRKLAAQKMNNEAADHTLQPTALADGADATGGSFADPLRAFKLGSTIPVKFRLSCGGVPVITGVHTLQAIKYSSSTTSDAAIDATPTDAATTGNQFRLTDTASGEWHFNLSTKSGFTKGIWKLIATLSDGSKHEVWIEIKK